MSLFAIPLLLSLSTPSFASIYVGNPKLTVRVAPATNIVFDEVTLEYGVPRADNCAPTALNGGNPVNVLGVALPVPVDVCAIGVETGETITIEGHGTAGGTFELILDVGDLVRTLQEDEKLWPEPTVSRAYILELGEAAWTSASALGLQSGQHVVIDDTDNLHDSLVLSLQEDSRLFRDDDGDGVLQSAERTAGSLD